MLISGVFPAELSPNLFIVQITGRPIYIDEEFALVTPPVTSPRVYNWLSRAPERYFLSLSSRREQEVGKESRNWGGRAI